MLDSLSQKFQGIVTRIAGKSQMTEKNVSEAVHEVRQALLSADVNHQVVKSLIEKIKEKAMGKKVIRSLSAGQQFIKVVHDEIADFMGGDEAHLIVNRRPGIVMVCGLQGSGKTTFVAKLGHYLKKKGRFVKPLFVACDLQRPAAVDQLKTLGQQCGIEVFSIDGEKNPVKVANEAVAYAKEKAHDLVILDTAGRLHIDQELMQELQEIKKTTQPEELLFVANASLGQEAVNVAQEFHSNVSITGTVLTMMDGTSRGGAALSIRHATGKPLKFEGVGEKIDDLLLFNPNSMADRILGMGDTINLVRKAEELLEDGELSDMEDKIKQASFTYEDLLKQFKMIKRMGSLKSLMGMVPGMSSLPMGDLDEKKFFQMEAMICSMTKRERKGVDTLEMSRRKRIAKGSGTQLDDVNRLVKLYTEAKDFCKKGPNMKKLEKMMGGKTPWR